MTDSQLCYMCGSLATSREHVPPKDIFPERKDLPDQSLRKELITVPSCEAHNSQKCADDEFLMVSLGGIIGNNSIGYRHKMTKINRAIRKSANRLLDKAFIERKHFILRLEDNKFMEVIRGTPDFFLLKKCFERIAYGIFFHHFKRRFKGQTRVLMTHFEQNHKNGATFIEFIKHRAEVELRDKERSGENPSVFFYQFGDPDQFGHFIVKMCFYGGCNILAAFIPEGTMKPFNLGMELKGGIETVIELEGKKYEFNKSQTSEIKVR